MKFKQTVCTFLFICTSMMFSQTKEVLFSIDNKPYYSDEFTRIYNKNIDLVKDESQKDLDKYLELFIGYKLKINKAIKLGLDKDQKYITELKNNRTQLAKNYMTDSKVTQELLNEAYSRYTKEIKASHILILVDENAAPADTLAAFNKITAIRNKALAGEDFAKLAEENSEDKSAKENKGDLGYFSVFRMVYPFENAAYNTKIKEISKPVRSKFGYHIIKVNDIRNNRGEITVAHIMIMKPTDATKETEAQNKIEDIYKKLQQGEKFESLAEQFSEDKSSSKKGGQLNKFSSGQLNSEEFEDVAFSLSKENPVSKPFKSEYGWHIVKFIEQFPLKSQKDMQVEFNSKISKDERSRKITNSLNTKLRKEYPTKRDNKLFEELANVVTNDYKLGTWKAPKDNKLFEKALFEINKKPIEGSKFLEYLEAQESTAKDSKLDIKTIVNNQYEKFLDVQLNTYYEANLENKFPEFSNVMDEYRDGLLLFDLMEKEIWEKSKTDTIGLKSFYDKNKQNYHWKNRLDVTVASSTKLDIIQKALQMLKENKTNDEIRIALNKDQKVEVMLNQSVLEEGSDKLQKNVKYEVGITDYIKNGDYYYVTKVNKLLPEGSKTFEEAKGKVINDYQQFLEANWVENLKKEFTVKVNNDVFEKVKKQITKK